MQLSQKEKTYSQYFAAFLKCSWNFKRLKKEDDPHRFCISEITDSGLGVDKCLNSPVSEDPSTSTMVNVPKHYLNLHHIIFIIFIDHCQLN